MAEHVDKPRSVWTSRSDSLNNLRNMPLTDETECFSEASVANYGDSANQNLIGKKISDDSKIAKNVVENIPNDFPVQQMEQLEQQISENIQQCQNENAQTEIIEPFDLKALKPPKKRWYYTSTYKYDPPKKYKYLWYLISLTSVTTIDVNMSYGGIELDISTFDAVLMIICVYLLDKCFEKGNYVLYAIPWLIVYFWSLYSCQYLSLVQILRTYSYTEAEITPIAYLSYVLLILSLGLRFIVWCKVLDLLVGTDFSEKVFYWMDLLVYMSNKIAWIYDTKRL